MKSLNIGLDYDGTYTADPDLWITFVKKAIQNNHKVYCITMRTPEELTDFDPELKSLITNIIPTSRKAKLVYMQDKPIYIDIWIDDNPIWLFQDSI